MPSQLLTEIDEQPAALARLLATRGDAVRDAAARIRAFDPAFVMIAARGSSDNAARYAQYLFGARNQLSVALASPSLFTRYDRPPRLDRALTIGISQSGQAPDVCAVLAEARRQGGLTLAITADAASPLADTADLCLTLAAGVEHAIAATKTYTSMLFVLAMLSSALNGEISDLLARIPEQVADALAGAVGIDEAAMDLASASRLLVVGRGFNYCTAHELALKIKETSYALAEPYSIADLLHGPVAMIEYGFPVVVVAPTGIFDDDVGALLDLLRERRARTLLLSDRGDLRASATVTLPAGVPEWLSPIVAIAPGQRLAHALAVVRGLDPDHPRGLAKVTLTR